MIITVIIRTSSRRPKPEPQTHTQRLMEFASIPRLFRSTDGESVALFHLGENGVQIVPVQHSLLRTHPNHPTKISLMDPRS